ncbi:MAG: hypothetical protein ABR560_07225, partial [Bacteroidales bacterium]
MRLRTVKILLIFYCLFGSMLLSGQVVDIPATIPVNEPEVSADTLEVTIPMLKPVRGAPVPAINGPQDIKLDRDASLRYLEKIYSANQMWRKSNDPLREAIRNLIWIASRPPADSVMSYLSDYGFEKIRVPADKYFIFDSIRIILPVIQTDSSAIDTVTAKPRTGEMFIEAGKRLEKVRLSADSKPVMTNDTLRLNDSVYIL